MKKYIIIFLIVLLIFTTVSCGSVDYQKIAFDKTLEYVNSLNSKDIDVQMKLLSAFKLDKDVYYDSFLKYVKSATFDGGNIEIVYEDKFIVIAEAKFVLVLSDEFSDNKRFKKGVNNCTRYFTYKKYENMKLVEILHKLIVRKEDSWIK